MAYVRFESLRDRDYPEVFRGFAQFRQIYWDSILNNTMTASFHILSNSLYKIWSLDYWALQKLQTNNKLVTLHIKLVNIWQVTLSFSTNTIKCKRNGEGVSRSFVSEPTQWIKITCGTLGVQPENCWANELSCLPFNENFYLPSSLTTKKTMWYLRLH
jgi:hypothetical protein